MKLVITKKNLCFSILFFFSQIFDSVGLTRKFISDLSAAATSCSFDRENELYESSIV